MENVNNYLEKPYNFVIRFIKDESGSYFCGRILEFDGCQTIGKTFEETYENLKDAMKGWIETKVEAGFEIPLPKEI